VARHGGTETPCPVTVGSVYVSPPVATYWTVGLPIRYQIEARIGVVQEAAKTRYEQRAAAGASKLDANSHAERLALHLAPNLDAP
jgi:hypothetical protein